MLQVLLASLCVSAAPDELVIAERARAADSSHARQLDAVLAVGAVRVCATGDQPATD